MKRSSLFLLEIFRSLLFFLYFWRKENTNGTRCLFIYLNSLGRRSSSSSSSQYPVVVEIMLWFRFIFLYSSGVWCFCACPERLNALLSDMIVLSRFGRQSLVVDIKESGSFFFFFSDSILVTLRAAQKNSGKERALLRSRRRALPRENLSLCKLRQRIKEKKPHCSLFSYSLSLSSSLVHCRRYRHPLYIYIYRYWLYMKKESRPQCAQEMLLSGISIMASHFVVCIRRIEGYWDQRVVMDSESGFVPTGERMLACCPIISLGNNLI